MIAVLADASLQPLRGQALLSTQFEFVPVTLFVAAFALYLWGVRRANRLDPRHRWSTRRTVAFLGGLGSTGVAICSFIGVYDGELFWDHMVQHLILIMVAAPLFAISSPVALACRATTRPPHFVITEVLRSRMARFLGHPATAFCLYAALISLTHLTAWYNYTLEHEPVHNAEHLVFLGLGYLFWRQVFGIDPNCHRMRPAGQVGYLLLAIPVDTFTGLSLAQKSREIFPASVALHRTWGISLVSDLHAGGLVMFVAGDMLMLWHMIPVVRRWLHPEIRGANWTDQGFDAAEEVDVDSYVASG